MCNSKNNLNRIINSNLKQLVMLTMLLFAQPVAANPIQLLFTSETLGAEVNDEGALVDKPVQLSQNGVAYTVNSISDDDHVQVDQDGVFLDKENDIFVVTFEGPVIVIGYSVGFTNEGVIGTYEFSTSNGDKLTEQPGAPAGAYTLSTPISLSKNESLFIEADVTGVSQLKQLLITLAPVDDDFCFPLITRNGAVATICL